MPPPTALKPHTPNAKTIWQFDIGYVKNGNPIEHIEEDFTSTAYTGPFLYQNTCIGNNVWKRRHPDNLGLLGSRPIAIDSSDLVNPHNVDNYQVDSFSNKANVIHVDMACPRKLERHVVLHRMRSQVHSSESLTELWKCPAPSAPAADKTFDISLQIQRLLGASRDQLPIKK